MNCHSNVRFEWYRLEINTLNAGIIKLKKNYEIKT